MDLSKAFDLVNHKKLLNILSTLGFRGHFLKLLESFLSHRTFRIKINDSFSDYAPSLQGVPQGSILSPILYCLYVHNFSIIHPDIIQYADDTTLIISYTNDEHLRNQLNSISEKITSYISEHNLAINTNKTDIMLFDKQNTLELNFMGSKIKTVQSTKFWVSNYI